MFDAVIQRRRLRSQRLGLVPHPQRLLVVLVITRIGVVVGVRRPVALPRDIVLRRLFNEPDALEDVRDVVDPTFLDAQLGRGVVEIERPVRLALDERDKLLREEAEGGVVARR